MSEVAVRKEMYRYGYESQARSMNGFAEMFSWPDFEERKNRMLAGLPEESVAVVNQILERLRVTVALKPNEELDLYTEEEQKAISETRRTLTEKIVKCADDLFIWNGYALPVNHFEPAVFQDGYGLKYLRSLNVIEDKAIIDAGAFVGDSALVLSPLTRGKVFAFEPLRKNFELLGMTCKLNGLENVVPENRALGDKPGEMTITVGIEGACATMKNRIPAAKQRQEQVEVITLDDYALEKGLVVGMIKVDVEGAEQLLLAGAKETIKRDRPILLISIYHNASDFLDIKPLIESWDLGYKFRVYHPPIKSISGETVLIAEYFGNDVKMESRTVYDNAGLNTPTRHMYRQIADTIGRLREQQRLHVVQNRYDAMLKVVKKEKPELEHSLSILKRIVEVW